MALAAALCAAAAACGGGEDKLAAAQEPEPPVGTPVLPDLMPKPQLNVATKQVDGRWRIYFNTTIVNVGAGDFILRAKRLVGSTWTAEQDIPYSDSGGRPVRVEAPLVWGGDGHEHWHIVRVASVWLEPLDANGRPVERAKRLVDTKIGFCFYDHTHELDRGPEDPRYFSKSCGDRDSTVVGMGLSPGWNDVYQQTLPGQSIDVNDLPNGTYRLWTAVDEQRRFREVTRANNVTWLDLKLTLSATGLTAATLGSGPKPA